MRKLLIPLILLVLLCVSFTASAHEEREIGAYEVELGWSIEPAYAGLYNGPEVFVHSADTGDAVTDLETTLHLMVHFGDQQKLLELYPVWNDPGHYTADLIPTRPGDYGFHLFGKIGDLDVDEEFTSADGKFGTVEPSTDILFPAPETSEDAASLQAQIDELRAQLEELKAAQTP